MKGAGKGSAPSPPSAADAQRYRESQERKRQEWKQQADTARKLAAARREGPEDASVHVLETALPMGGVQAMPENLPLVQFFHDIDAELWCRQQEALTALAAMSSAGSFEFPEAFVAAVRSIHKLGDDYMNTRSFDALNLSLSKMPEVGLGAPEEFLGSTVAWLAHLVLQLPDLFPDGLAMLIAGVNNRQCLSRRQCAAILAASFLGVLPGNIAQCFARSEAGGGCPDLPEFQLRYVMQREPQKCFCLLSYFLWASNASDTRMQEVVSFSRRAIEPLSPNFWHELDLPLLEAVVAEGLIEESLDCLQADFANMYLGGGALNRGNVQEELRFAMSPECYVGMLFCEVMLPNEAVFIAGTQQVNAIAGYGGGYRFAGPHIVEPGQPDELGRRGPRLVAFDATCYLGCDPSLQFGDAYVLRELQKAYAAFLPMPEEEGAGDALAPVATGNWGCGVFGGDAQLKSLLQWLAASVAGRTLRYHDFGDRRVSELATMFQELQERGVRCADLFELIRGHSADQVFDRVHARVRRGQFSDGQSSVEDPGPRGFPV